MTIDELARRAGTTSRNIRSYQERGLVPPPRVVGRVGYYDEGHLARLDHIAQLLGRGFSLASIHELFAAWEGGYGLAQVLGFEQALAAPWDDEPSTTMTLEEIVEVFGDDPQLLPRAVGMGILVPEDGGFRVPSPRLVRAGAELVAAGVPIGCVLDEAAALQADLDAVASRFVELFVEHVWAPYQQRGMPRKELPHITEILERLRPVAAMAVESVLAQAMARRVAATSAETLSQAPSEPAARRRTDAAARSRRTPRKKGIGRID
jgi:DNA-binding transcriptional MerR regulator